MFFVALEVPHCQHSNLRPIRYNDAPKPSLNPFDALDGHMGLAFWVVHSTQPCDRDQMALRLVRF